MIPDPKTKTEICGTLVDYCHAYSGCVHYGGRKVLPETIKFEIGTPEKTYFEGSLEGGVIQWRRLSGAPLAKEALTGRMNEATGGWDIIFNDHSLLQPGEQITITYDWQPHHLTDAEVLVRVNNEERFVPIRELQSALYSYLGE